MSQNLSIGTVQSAIGYYFKTPSLINAAFTHVSMNDTENNEALIFLGEHLLDFVISDYVANHYPFSTEKQLRSRLESTKKALDYKSFISDKKLTPCIGLSAKNEVLRDDRELHGEIFLAICAAIYKDGGLPSLKAFILPLIRAVDSETRYTPKTETKTSVNPERTASSDVGSSDKTVTVKRSDTVRRAETVAVSTENKKDKATEKKKTDDKPITAAKEKNEKKAEEKADVSKEKKVGGLLKAIMLPSKGRKKDTEALPSTSAESVAKTEENGTVKRSFIRDALAPVSLPESMRNPKPKKPFKSSEQSTPAMVNEVKDTDASCEDTENYKSLLQEYVQKNIRSANVLIKYNTVREKGVFVTEITLDGKLLAKSEGAIKKSAEKSAAKIAYEEITNKESSLSGWFNSVSSLTPERAPISYVSKLNEYYQKKSRSSAAPLTYEMRPSSEKKTFSVAIVFNGEELALASAHTVKDAKQEAAKKVCEKLNIK